MGICCSCIDDVIFEYSKDINGKIRCAKCGDRYKPTWGCKSERTSCRYHTYKIKDEKIFCIDCNSFNSNIRGRCCYHTYGQIT